MKNVLITGGNGFIGSNFLNYIVNKYPDVNFYNYDCNYYCSSKKNTENLNNKSNYKVYNNKLQSLESLLSLFENERIDTVIHFAAQSHVSNSFINPLEFTNDNIIGTHTLLEAVRTSIENNKISFNKFIYISTDEVYGDNDTFDKYDIKTESSKLNPTNPYAATKAAAEMLVNSYFHSFKIPIIIVRSNNVYGKYQYYEKVIPKFIYQVLDNKKITIQGNCGLNRRCFLYIDDFISGLEIILTKGKINEIYNIGSGNEITILDLAKKIIKMTNENDNDNDNENENENENFNNRITFIKDRNYNDKRYYISNDKLMELGWIQNYNLDRGLKETIEWYKRNRDYWISELT
jgi:dTDP-glucose 4,6-dehydratase